MIIVERENAGNGELKVEIVDPTGQPLKIEKTKSPNGEERIIFLPTRLGQHKLTAKLSGFVVNGTLFIMIVINKFFWRVVKGYEIDFQGKKSEMFII